MPSGVHSPLPTRDHSGRTATECQTEGELVDVLPRALAEPGPSVVGVDTNSIRNIDLGEKLLPDSFE